jgi:flagellin
LGSRIFRSSISFEYGLNNFSGSKDITFGAFYFDDVRNKTHAGEITVSFDSLSASAPGDANFTVAYPGKTAQAGVRLRDLDAFWDVNGRYLLDEPADIYLSQGDGARTIVTIYGTDTLGDVRAKLDDAVAYGLGQNRYAPGAGGKFVTFTENGLYGTQEPSAGMFVIRSAIPGTSGTISVNGPEDIAGALKLRVTQDPEENIYVVSVYDAYSGSPVNTAQKVSGNVLPRAINENVGVRFDGLTAAEARWNESSKAFSWKTKPGAYEASLHISDNRTVFQVGANEGESIATGIGDMSAEMLGVSDVLVTSRAQASRAVTKITGALARVSRERASIGATQNRLEHAVNYLATASENSSVAENEIRGADLAGEAMAYARLRILSRVGSAIFAQANRMPESMLSLIS